VGFGTLWIFLNWIT